MNKYQKIALILGVIALIFAYGKIITKIGFSAMALMGKGLIIIVATLLIISFLKKAGKNK